MANNGNLKTLSPDEARIQGQKGGIASGEARRRKRDLRFALLALMDGDVNGMTGMEAMAAALYQKALAGDVAAIKLIQGLVLAGNQIESEEEMGLWLGI